MERKTSFPSNKYFRVCDWICVKLSIPNTRWTSRSSSSAILWVAPTGICNADSHWTDFADSFLQTDTSLVKSIYEYLCKTWAFPRTQPRVCGNRMYTKPVAWDDAIYQSHNFLKNLNFSPISVRKKNISGTHVWEKFQDKSDFEKKNYLVAQFG